MHIPMMLTSKATLFFFLAHSLVALGCGSTKPGFVSADGSASDDARELEDAPVASLDMLDVGGGEQVADANPAVDAAPPTCIETLIPTRCQAGYDTKLELLATEYERSFHAISAATLDVWADIDVKDPANQKILETFIRQGTSWDFKADTGKEITKVVTQWQKTAGLYGGVGIAADAFRYGVLRDHGYPAAEVARARKHLLAALEGLHIAKSITGSAPSIARGFVRTDIPTYIYPTTPLLDGQGKPLPAEKNNGTWRKDNSGALPKYIWEDSCSRDQLVGWIAAYGAAWEVVRSDATIPQIHKQRLQQATRQLGLGLMKVQKSGYDLELVDADGRTTYHGYLHENNLDRFYLPIPLIKNGMHAVMALGIVATLAYVSGDLQLKDYLNKTLIGQRKLHDVFRDSLIIDFGAKTNYSAYNMAFMGAWLSARYLDNAQALGVVRKALAAKLYNNPQAPTKPQPVGWKQSLFDLIYAAGAAAASAHGPTKGQVDGNAVARAQQTLLEFPRPPYWSKVVTNCDAKELASKVCVAADGKTKLPLNPTNDRGDHPQSLTPVPYHLRPPSNYDWRSNPFRVNGSGSGGTMLSGVDFRVAYWIGRWVRR